MKPSDDFHIVATGLYFHRISEVILYHNKWAMVKVKNSLPTLILIFGDLHHESIVCGK